MSPSRNPRLALVTAAFVGWAMVTPLLATPDAGTAPEGPRIPRPDLGTMDAAARGKVEAMQSTLEEMLRRGDSDTSELGEAFGFLGQLFQAFHLLEAAEEAYGAARGLAPEDGRWAYYRGLARNARGRFEGALADYEAALKLQGDNLATSIRMGNALLELNRPTDAKARFEEILAVEAETAAAHFGLGKAAELGGDLEAAIRHYEKALELQPQADTIHYPLGQAYRRLGDLERAREHLRRRGQNEILYPDPLGRRIARLAKGTAFEVVLSMARASDDFSEEEFLGFVLSQFSDVQGTIEQLRRGLAEEETTGESGVRAVERARIHFVLGGLQVNAGRDEEAIDSFRQALALAPDMLEPAIKLGNALARGGKLEEALAQYERVLDVDPEHLAARLKRAAALMELERFREATTDLTRLIEIDPSLGEAHVRLGASLERLGEAEAAIERYRAATALDLQPRERLEATFRLASLLRARGALDEAAQSFAKALEADPEFVPALGGLGQLMAQTGNFDEAAKHYATWSAVEPEKLAPRMAEATALIFAGHHAAARDRLEAGLGVFPDSLQIKDVLARHLAACPHLAVRDGARALELARQVFEELPSGESMETLAMAHAEVGRFTEAVEWQQKILDSLSDDVPAERAELLRQNMTLYREGKRCCVGQ